MKFIRFVEQSHKTPRWGRLEGDSITPLTCAPYLYDAIDAGESILLSEVELLAPATPSKILCVGRNYAEHAAELGNEVPDRPLIFLKPPSSLLGAGQPVMHPDVSKRIDHEAELALVIGRRCRYLKKREIKDVIFGYTVANDVTARDLREPDKQWARAKGFDTFCPLGPWIDTGYEPSNKTIRCTVDGEMRQESNTDLMIYPIPEILIYLSNAMTLEPGDLILTGTPSGVAPVSPGMTMTVEIEGLGSISNSMISEAEYKRTLS